MSKRNTKTNQDNAIASAAAGETKTADAAAQDGRDASGTEDHPNPSRAASDAAETAATEAAAKVMDAALAGAYLKTEGSESAAADKPAAASKSKADPFAALAKEYAKLYPKNKIFHITSDKQVFLEGSKGLADLHQRGLKGGAVTSITIN